MNLAIMQPYLFPYIGYFQLMAAVDKFVVFDDVNYINRGWINRNRILLNAAAHTFTVPLQGASQNRLICDIELVNDSIWRDKLLRTLQLAYGKAPFYSLVSGLVESIIQYPGNQLDQLLLNSLREVNRYLGLEVEIVSTSRIYQNSHLKGQERILDICLKEQADIYINPIGGLELYEKAKFSEKGVQLFFLRSRPISYPQGQGEHVPWLSIIDVLMYNDPAAIRQLLFERDLI
jgi:hypothetical protein